MFLGLKVAIFGLIVFASTCNSIKFPDWIEKCKKDDPDLSACVKDRFPKVVPKLINGVKEMHIPNLNPFHLESITIEATDSLTIKLANIDVYGLADAKLIESRSDMKTFETHNDILFPEIKLNGIYDINGKILILPIVGHGNATMSLKNAVFSISFQWDVVPNAKGINHAQFRNPTVTYKTEKASFHFDNLFNGDKAMGDQMNAFINENWRDFSKDISPAVNKAVAQVIFGIFQSFADSFAYEDFWA